MLTLLVPWHVDIIILIHWLVSLSYSVYLTNVESTEPEAESDTHASFESGFRNNSIVQNNNYSYYHNYQKTPSFLAPLYTLCFWKSTIVVIFKQHLENPEGPSPLVTTYSPSSATSSDVLPLPLITWLSHVVSAPRGQQISSWVTCVATPSFIQNLHVAKKRVGAGYGGLMAPKMSQLDFLCWPHQVSFFFFIHPRKQTGPTSNPNFWLGSPKSVTMTSMIGSWSILGVLISITVFP